MPYRNDPQPHHPPHRSTLHDISTPALLYVQNGTIADYAFPCWYQEIHQPLKAHLHCKDWHDHVGEPSPHHPDQSCQPYDEFAAWWTEAHEIDRRYPNFHNSPYELRHAHRRLIDMGGLTPIHLKKEGYFRFSTYCEAEEDHVKLEPTVDDARDYIIRLRITAKDEDVVDEPKDYRFAIYVEGQFKESPKAKERDMRDLALSGILRILPNVPSHLALF